MVFPLISRRSKPTLRRQSPHQQSRTRLLPYLTAVIFMIGLLSQLRSLASGLRGSSLASTQSACPLRRYPPHRYYDIGKNSKVPDFLKGEYIYGAWPVILETSPPLKLCVDQSAWLSNTRTLPFADGTNPSILTIDRTEAHFAKFGNAVGLREAYPTARYLATACMTNSQCRWKDSGKELIDYHLSNRSEPEVVLTVLLLLDADLRTLAQHTLEVVLDSDWGKRVQKATENGVAVRHRPALDDTRLFLHSGQVWVSYREGRGFGWDAQVLNPIRFTSMSPMTAELRASDTTSFCCGRNMALMENLEDASALQSLTWVDPVTVQAVNTSPMSRRLEVDHRRLKDTKHKSHIHGTNAFMVYLPTEDQFIGIGHFHRPPDREQNPYARFGHHYTHAWFTISAHPPYRLVGLSAEFVLPSAHDRSDAEIIQFASGLELDGDDLVIAYGINDCEAAVVRIPWVTVKGTLRPIEQGMQVVNYMQLLKSN